MKFKVGDRVRAKPNNGYLITTTRVGIMQVTKVSGTTITVKILKGDRICSRYPVQAKDFVKVGSGKDKLSAREFKEEVTQYCLDQLRNLKVKTLNRNLMFTDKFIKIGCQRITPKDALLIADRIEMAYGHMRK